MLTDGNPVNLTTPLYPAANYPADTSCEYDVTVPAGNRVLVEFLDFALKENSDFLTVDGIVHTGRNVPDTYTSTDNTLNIQFSSDSSTGEKGFLLRLSLVPGILVY